MIVRDWHVEGEWAWEWEWAAAGGSFTEAVVVEEVVMVDKDGIEEAVDAEEREERVDVESRPLTVSFVLWARGGMHRYSRFVQMQTYAPIVGIAWAHSSSSRRIKERRCAGGGGGLARVSAAP